MVKVSAKRASTGEWLRDAERRRSTSASPHPRCCAGTFSHRGEGWRRRPLMLRDVAPESRCRHCPADQVRYQLIAVPDSRIRPARSTAAALDPIAAPWSKASFSAFSPWRSSRAATPRVKAIGDRMTVFEIGVLRDGLRLRRAALRAPAARALARHVPHASAGAGDGARGRGRARRHLQHLRLHDAAVRRGLFADLPRRRSS